MWPQTHSPAPLQSPHPAVWLAAGFSVGSVGTGLCAARSIQPLPGMEEMRVGASNRGACKTVMLIGGYILQLLSRMGRAATQSMKRGGWGGWDMGLGCESNTHHIRYPPGEQRGGCSPAGCYAPHQQRLFLHAMLVLQRWLQHPGAHVCCLPAGAADPHLGQRLGVLGQGWHQPRSPGVSGQLAQPQGYAQCQPGEPGCHLPASSPMPPAGARTPLEEQRGDSSRRDGTVPGEGAPSCSFSHLAWQDLSQPSLSCSGCAVEETLCQLCPFQR